MSYFLLLAVALGVAAIGCGLRKRLAGFGNALIVLGCAGCVALIGWQARETFSGEAPKPTDSYLATVSYALAQEVIRDLAGQSGKLTLIFPSERGMDAETADTATYVFARVLRAAPGLRIGPTVRSVESAQLTVVEFASALGEPDLVACVSFAGVPTGFESSPLLQRGNAPKLYVFDASGGTAWLAALRSGAIRRVIVPRPGAKPTTGETVEGRPEQIFDKFFLLGTPQTAEKLDAQLKAGK